MSFIEFCKQEIDPFFLSDEEKKVYQDFSDYLKGVGEFDQSKGVFVRGVVGCGKTIMFRMAQRYSGTVRRKFKMVNAETIVCNFESKSSIDRFFIDEWCFDDLGTEDKANNYGKGVEIFKRLIESRYDLWKNYGVRTHFTSNVSNDIILERYGERAYERLKEMCNVVKYPLNQSKRGASKVKLLTQIENDIKTPSDLLAEYEQKVKLNEESLKRMILNGYDHCLKSKSRRTAKIHTECVDVLKQKKLYDIGVSMWPDLIKKARLEFIDKQDNIRQAVKLADKNDHTAAAKIMYVWAQFEAWKESGMMDLETLSGLLDEERILPSDYNEKIEELTKNKIV